MVIWMDLSSGIIGYMDLHPSIHTVDRNIQFTRLLISTLEGRSLE
uniref:Uncharacterized protein n=1 Tax=Lepeophtheirus salmonis TaxID=72036 RepID=A0A0K2UB24_LEPSM